MPRIKGVKGGSSSTAPKPKGIAGVIGKARRVADKAAGKVADAVIGGTTNPTYARNMNARVRKSRKGR